jgi:cytoskeletal protein RodZ
LVTRTVHAERITNETRRPGPADAGFGEGLRRAREARGMTVADVAEKTRIAPHHLEALERSDFDALPPGPFGRSYIRSYAEVLGIDAGPILATYHAQEVRRGVGTPERDERMLQELSHLVRSGEEGRGRLLGGHTRPLAAAAAVALVVLAAAGWLATREAGRERPDRTAVAGPPVAAPTSVPVAPPAGAPVAAPGAPPRPSSIPSPDTRPRSPTSPPRVRPSPAAGPASPRPQLAARPDTRLGNDKLQVSELGVGTNVLDHRLVGRADRFPDGTRVFFWTVVVGGQRGQVVRHVWYQGGRAVMRIDLPIGAAHWRTRSSLVLPGGSAGPWTVEARTTDGRLLARNDFLCERRRSR